MKNNTFPFILLALLISGGLAGCTDDDKTGSSPPPHDNPPLSSQPPNEEPPVDEPPAEEPPAEEPPSEEPPVEQPPTEEPPSAGSLVLDPDIVSRGVAPNGNLVLRSDRALDATSVETSIQLRDAETTETVPAMIEYETGTQRVIVTPATRLLEEGKHYAVQASNLRDVDGNIIEIAGQSIARVKTRVYKRTIVYRPDGGVSFYTLFNRLPGSSDALNVFYDGPGIDAWFEGEDEVRYYETVQYLPGNVKITRKYENPGEGGAWFDDNDIMSTATRQTYDNAQRLLEELVVVDDGEDDDLFTDDDDYVWAIFNLYDDDGRLAISASIHEGLVELTPGTDGLWLTTDDQSFLYTRYEYNDSGRRVRELQMTRSTGDEPFGDADRVAHYRDYHYDEDGRIAEIVPYNCGIQCFDDDDEVVFFTRFHRIGSTVSEEIVYATDGHADDDDHDLMEYQYREYDEQGRITKSGFFDERGDDRLWHTPDDFTDGGSGTIYSYGTDELGQPESRTMSLDGNGTDQKRFSGDEEITFLAIQTYDGTSQLTRYRTFSGPGPIPGWKDGDEVRFGDSEYLETDE